jgi:hypothetical protein
LVFSPTILYYQAISIPFGENTNRGHIFFTFY